MQVGSRRSWSPVLGSVSALLLATAPLAAQSRGSLQASARVLPTPARAVLDSAVQHAISSVRGGEAGGRSATVRWAAARLEADRRELAAQMRIVVTVSYVRN